MYSRLSSLLRSWIAGRLVTSQGLVDLHQPQVGQPTVHYPRKFQVDELI
jgi:hypothetical protein